MAAEEETNHNTVNGKLDYMQITHLSENAQMVVLDLLQLNPKDRPTAQELLDNHEWLKSETYKFGYELVGLAEKHKQVSFSVSARTPELSCISPPHEDHTKRVALHCSCKFDAKLTWSKSFERHQRWTFKSGMYAAMASSCNVAMGGMHRYA